MLKERETLLVRMFFSQILVYLKGVRCTGEKRDPIYMYKVQCPWYTFHSGKVSMYDICDEKYGACGHSGLSWLFLG